MKWYRYWVTAMGEMVFENYFFFPTSFTTEEIKDNCETWAVKKTDMQYTYYSYDFEEVEIPPKKWLLKEIETNTLRTIALNTKNEMYQKIIEEHYRLNDKIVKLKNNISDEMV